MRMEARGWEWMAGLIPDGLKVTGYLVPGTPLYNRIIDTLILLILFIVFTNPISSHVLARAAHQRGIRLSEKFSVRDCLSDDEAGEEGVCE